MEARVELERLRKTFVRVKRRGFRRERTEVVAVDDVSLSIPAGQSVAFIGPNGAGKSTTIKMFTGILLPTSGEARVLGLTPWRERKKLAYHIGAVFGQRSQLWYHLPPRDTFELLARIYALDRAAYARARDVLIERFGLGPFLDVPVRKLSLGQRMRAEIAASLLHAPKVLFLDEPTIGLLGSKVLSVRFHAPPAAIDLPGTVTLKATEYALKLEVDTRVTPIERVMAEVLRAGAVADIAIEDPPLEEVIAHIYGQAGAPEGEGEATEP